MSTYQILSLTGTLITALLALSGIVIAFVGLKTWRRQLKGTHDFELAKRLMLDAYNLEESIKQFRNPFIIGNNERDEYDRRWKEVVSFANELRASLTEAQIIWDKSKSQGYKTSVNKLIGELIIALRHYLTDQDNSKKSNYTQLLSKNDMNVLYSDYEDNIDSYSAKVDEFIKSIENFAKPYLE
jgi:hypothetical protein